MKSGTIAGLILFVAIVCCLAPSKVLALSNEEKIQKLDDKFINGEMSEETYKRLLKKYRGKTDEEKPAQEKTKPVEEAAENLVKNFSFEEQTDDGSAKAWEIQHKGSTVVNIGLNTENSHTGKNSMRFSSDSTSHSTEVAGQRIPLQPGKKYKVVFWAKGDNLKSAPKADGTPCVVNLDYKTKDGKLQPLYIEPKIGNEWKMVAKVVKIPSDALEGGDVSLRLYMATGTLWIDDVVVAPLQ